MTCVMRATSCVLMGVLVACGGGTGDKGGGASNTPIALPKVYPPVRANTPSALVTDPAYAKLIGQGQALTAVNLASVVQQRLYSGGPTSLLRIVTEIDARAGGLDTRPSRHGCLTTAPVSHTYALPGGQSFTVKLQCLQQFSAGGWIAFGFAEALAAPDAGGGDKNDKDGGGAEEGKPDGGALGTDGGGGDFYLIEGQANGMGAAYHFDRRSGDLEGWIAVADKVATSNSQVLMHLFTSQAGGTVELTFAGSGVGFCSAHLKTNASHIFVSGKTNAPPPPGTPMSPDAQYCDEVRTGCFAAAALDSELGASDPACARLAAGTFALTKTLDASGAAGANVVPAMIHGYFSAPPSGVPAF